MRLKNNLKEAKNFGLDANLENEKSFKMTIRVKIMDNLGKMHSIESKKVIEQTMNQCAFVKLINVPSQLDINGVSADPTDESL